MNGLLLLLFGIGYLQRPVDDTTMMRNTHSHTCVEKTLWSVANWCLRVLSLARQTRVLCNRYIKRTYHLPPPVQRVKKFCNFDTIAREKKRVCIYAWKYLREILHYTRKTCEIAVYCRTLYYKDLTMINTFGGEGKQGIIVVLVGRNDFAGHGVNLSG